MWYLLNTEISLTKSVMSFNVPLPLLAFHMKEVYLPSRNADGREHEGSIVVPINLA